MTMLVVSRFSGQDIIIDTSDGLIVVHVVDVQHQRGERMKAKIGIEAPSHVPVHRREVWEAIQKERNQ